MKFWVIKCLGIFSFVFYACNPTSIKKEENSFEKIKKFFAEKQFHAFNSSTKCVLIVSETGCIGCNKSMSLMAQNYVSNKNCVLLIEARGGLIDISPFENVNAENIYLDSSGEFRKLQIIENSGAIHLNGNKIDTIISLDAKILTQQLEFIQSRITREEQ